MKKVFLAMCLLVSTISVVDAACILRFKDKAGTTRYIFLNGVDCSFFVSLEGLQSLAGLMRNNGFTNFTGCTAARQGPNTGVKPDGILTEQWVIKENLTKFLNTNKEVVAVVEGKPIFPILLVGLKDKTYYFCESLLLPENASDIEFAVYAHPNGPHDKLFAEHPKMGSVKLPTIPPLSKPGTVALESGAVYCTCYNEATKETISLKCLGINCQPCCEGIFGLRTAQVFSPY